MDIHIARRYHVEIIITPWQQDPNGLMEKRKAVSVGNYSVGGHSEPAPDFRAGLTTTSS